jgi:hypothetical protein
MKRTALIVGLVGVAAILSAGYHFIKSRNHEVIYKVHGKAGSKFLTIKYLDTPAYGGFSGNRLKRVRIPAIALPWTTKVYLPDNAITHVSVSNEQGKKSALRINVSVDKREKRAWPGQDMEEFSDTGIIFRIADKNRVEAAD